MYNCDQYSTFCSSKEQSTLCTEYTLVKVCSRKCFLTLLFIQSRLLSSTGETFSPCMLACLQLTFPKQKTLRSHGGPDDKAVGLVERVGQTHKHLWPVHP